MELKEGYKQTEVGVIPEDWDVKPLRDGLSEAPAYGINAPAQTYKKGLPAYIRITDITDEGAYNPPEQTYVEAPDGRKYFLREGDIVLARTGASVGKSYLYHKRDGKLVYAGFLIRIHPDSVTYYPDYIFYFIHSAQYWKWVAQTSIRSGQPGINGAEYGELLCPCPSVAEQKTIASVLSDVDALLSSLDALIAKKRDIKTAAMQELLTGKRRLPGFSGGWKKAFAYEYGEFVRGVSYDPDRDLSYKNKENTFILLRANNINNNFINFFDIYYINKNIVDESQILKDGDILFCMSNGSKRLVGKSASYDGYFSNTATFGAFMGVLRPSNNLNKSFLKYIFQSYRFSSYINIILSGSAINNLTPANILNFDFSIPTNPEEQAAIAAVLSDMDAEIAALEARRAKVQTLKQGMMQELLTGRTRLLPDGEQHG